jgi:hypothetical protein
VQPEKLKEFILILIPVMDEVVLYFLVVLAFVFLLRGVWWFLNWIAFRPRPILAENDAGPAFAATGNTGRQTDLRSVFRMSSTLQVIYCVLLLLPPVASIVLVVKVWEGWQIFLTDLLLGLMHPSSFFLTAIVFLLCPFSAWNIYWRRHDYIRFGSDEIEYRSGFKSAKLVPVRITMYRARSWRFDLVDLFRGEMATSWFLEITTKTGKNGVIEGLESEMLDLKAMNLGGRTRAIARTACHFYGDKFLIHNQLPKPE